MKANKNTMCLYVCVTFRQKSVNGNYMLFIKNHSRQNDLNAAIRDGGDCGLADGLIQ